MYTSSLCIHPAEPEKEFRMKKEGEGKGTERRDNDDANVLRGNTLMFFFHFFTNKTPVCCVCVCQMTALKDTHPAQFSSANACIVNYRFVQVQKNQNREKRGRKRHTNMHVHAH